MDNQIGMFEGAQKLKIDKPIRLIELFAGIGAQAKALENLHIPFEHYRICEIDKYAVKSYNVIHNTNFKPTDITKINGFDLGITETDKYCYVITYSFPCQDLSVAGKQRGMEKGSGTRSGLLWEVERLLTECKEKPQILLMENVPQVIGSKNIKHFAKWLKFLESLGYKNKWQLLNSKNYGIPQNRNRCFMVSFLGDYYYEFPKPFELKLRLKDMLEEKVDKKYYLSDKIIKFFLNNTKKQKENNNGFKFEPTNGDSVAKSVTTRAGRRMDDNFVLEPTIVQNPHGYNKGNETKLCPAITKSAWENNNFLKEPKLIQVGQIDGFASVGRIYSSDGLCPTINTCQGGNQEPKILDEQNKYIRTDSCVGTLTTDGSSPKHNNRIIEISNKIRRLTPLECWRLMGFTDSDFNKAKEAGISDTQLYKQAGNSIVVQVLENIFKELF